MIFAENTKLQAVLEGQNHVLVRSSQRQTELGEVFTPTELVLEILEHLPDDLWQEDKTYLDPTCGNGQFLAAVLIIKQSLGHQNPLQTIYGVDLMQDNVDECRARLLKIAGDTAENRAIVEWNIRQGDGTVFDYEVEFDRELKAARDQFEKDQNDLFGW